MKKSLLILATVAFGANAAIAQSNFKLQNVPFVGAMGSRTADDWTTGWTNFDPKNTNYPTPTDQTTLNGAATGKVDITATVTLNPNTVYLLQGLVVVRNGGKLIIPAGTVIRCQADVSAVTPRNYATLVVERGGQIEANGTRQNPIVFTSAKPAGQRERGDWGGIAICGRARNNQQDNVNNNNVQLEGYSNVSSAIDNGLCFYGGTVDNDNSGFMRYVRIEFAGFAFEPNKEVNALTMASVGSATEINNVQVSFSGDDAFEWFGGTVNSRNLVAYKTTDDDFDTDFGYSGINQFGIAVRDTNYYDLTYNAASNASTSETFESDNDANGTGVSPFTTPIFSNFTVVGPVPMGSTWSALGSVSKAAFRRGARVRRNSSCRIVNSVFMGYRNFVMFDGDSTVRNTNFGAALTGLNLPAVAQNRQLLFANNIVVNTAAALAPATTTANGLVEVSTAARLTPMNDFIRSTESANRIDPVAFTAGTLLVNPSAYSMIPDFRPVAGSPANTGASFTNPILTNLLSNTKEIEQAVRFAPVYPNPVTGGVLNLGRKVESFGIFDISGRLVTQGFNAEQVFINLSKGVYFIKMDGQMQKLIVQ